MMRGSLGWVLKSCRPVVEFGLPLFGWLKALKKSAVNRSFKRSVRLKFLNSEISEFQARGPRKNAREFQLTVSVMDVSRDVPLASVWGKRLSKAAPSGWIARAPRSTGTSA